MQDGQAVPNQDLPPENNSDGEELERRTIAMIDKINRVL